MPQQDAMSAGSSSSARCVRARGRLHMRRPPGGRAMTSRTSRDRSLPHLLAEGGGANWEPCRLGHGPHSGRQVRRSAQVEGPVRPARAQPRGFWGPCRQALSAAAPLLARGRGGTEERPGVTREARRLRAQTPPGDLEGPRQRPARRRMRTRCTRAVLRLLTRAPWPTPARALSNRCRWKTRW